MPRTKTNRADKKPTWTHLTLDTLSTLDDFATQPQLCELTGANACQMSASLIHLKKVGAVDAVEADGRLWWFCTGLDRRTYRLEERTPEEPGTRRRGPRKPRAEQQEQQP